MFFFRSTCFNKGQWRNKEIKTSKIFHPLGGVKLTIENFKLLLVQTLRSRCNFYYISDYGIKILTKKHYCRIMDMSVWGRVKGSHANKRFDRKIKAVFTFNVSVLVQMLFFLYFKTIFSMRKKLQFCSKKSILQF